MARIIRLLPLCCVPKWQAQYTTIRFMDERLQVWTEARLGHLMAGAGRTDRWTPIRVEASHRRFYRVRWHAEGAARASFVVMASPPDLENNDQFVALADLFRQRGIGVPELLARDEDQGYFLMSDLGETHFEDVYADRGPAAVLPEALGTLHRLQQIDDPRVPPYTRARFRDELRLYVTWCLGALLDLEPPAALDEVFEHLMASTGTQPVCCVHRDFHCRNLLKTPSGGVGVVDFQDALMGPATYDLASLLRDCYYRLPEAEVGRWRDEYLARTPLEVDRPRFAMDFDFTALQRQLKAVGIFARLSLRDGRDSHLAYIVPVLGRIGDLAAKYPLMSPLAEHTDALLPRVRARLGAAA